MIPDFVEGQHETMLAALEEGARAIAELGSEAPDDDLEAPVLPELLRTPPPRIPTHAVAEATYSFFGEWSSLLLRALRSEESLRESSERTFAALRSVGFAFGSMLYTGMWGLEDPEAIAASRAGDDGPIHERLRPVVLGLAETQYLDVLAAPWRESMLPGLFSSNVISGMLFRAGRLAIPLADGSGWDPRFDANWWRWDYESPCTMHVSTAVLKPLLVFLHTPDLIRRAGCTRQFYWGAFRVLDAAGASGFPFSLEKMMIIALCGLKFAEASHDHALAEDMASQFDTVAELGTKTGELPPEHLKLYPSMDAGERTWREEVQRLAEERNLGTLWVHSRKERAAGLRNSF